MNKMDQISPDMLQPYCIYKKDISKDVTEWKYGLGNETGYIRGCRLYPGILMWNNDFYAHSIPNNTIEEYHYLKINYCLRGRCEVSLMDNRYVYLEKGILSIDLNQPGNAFIAPTGRYEGIEIIFDVDYIKDHMPSMFADCGINMQELYESLKGQNGSYIARASKEVQDIAERVACRLNHGQGTIEEYRFEALSLMYHICYKGAKSKGQINYLTRGQKNIAMEVEKKIKSNYKVRYTIENLAKEYGISASSLKKYFEQVYGSPISRYLRRLRMDYAAELLVTTNMSIADIADAAGYANQGKFGSAFREHTGNTPLEYRRLQYERRIEDD